MAGADNRGEGGGGGGGGATSRAPPTTPPAAPTSSLSRSEEGDSAEPLRLFTSVVQAIGVRSEVQVFRPCLARGPNPGQPVCWFTRLAVATGVRSDLNRWRGYTARDHISGNPTVPVKLPPVSLRRSELAQVRRQLDNILKEVQIQLKTPAEFDGNVRVPVKQKWSGLMLKGSLALAFGMVSARHPGGIPAGILWLWEICNNAVGVAMRNESENDKYVRVVQEFTLSMKAVINYARENEEISAEFADDMVNIADKFNNNISMALSQDGRHLFSLNGLKGLLQVPDNITSIADKLIAFGSAMRSVTNIVEAAYRVTQTVGGPCLFQDIGKEAIVCYVWVRIR